MTTDALRDYVHFLREQRGVRNTKLSLAARQGLAKLVTTSSAAGRPGSRQAADDREVIPPNPRPATSQPEIPAPQRAATTPSASPRTTISAEPATPLVVTGSTKIEQLAHLADRAKACVKCPHLVARRHHVVFGVGNPDARLMFIGEAPGEEEDLQGEPFVGRAGQLLTKMIIAMGLTREQVYIANIVKCRPDMPPGAPGNRKPTKQEMDTCVPYLRAQVEVIKPGAIVALGATSVEGLLGPIGSIGQLRGRFHEYRGIPLMPTYHPSYLLRNASNTEKRKVWDDLLKVMEKLEMPISEKQRGYFLAK